MHEWQSFVTALRVGGAVMYPLLALALVAVIVILDKAFVFVARTRVPATLLPAVDTSGLGSDEVERELAALGPRHYVGRFLRVIVENRKRPSWWVESRATEEAAVVEKS